jgi:hypothetical protein
VHRLIVRSKFGDAPGTFVRGGIGQPGSQVATHDDRKVKKMRKLIVLATGTAVAVAGLITLAATANAGGSNSVITKSTTSYTSPSNQSIRVSSLTQGTQVESLCFTEGQMLNGNPNWFRISKDGNSAQYVHRDAISAPKDLKHC